MDDKKIAHNNCGGNIQNDVQVCEKCGATGERMRFEEPIDNVLYAEFMTLEEELEFRKSLQGKDYAT